MANAEHVAVLKQGTKAWSQWLHENPTVVPHLSGASFSRANLEGVNLTKANLEGANFSRANLEGADFSRAYLKFTYLSGANLKGANLSEANLIGTFLSEAKLNLADLIGAYLKSTVLGETSLAEARCGYTTLANLDLREVTGLDTIRHIGPSTIGIDTIYRSNGSIPESFLRGAGMPDNLITSMKSLISQGPDFYSCFISHSSKDKEFAERVYADLQSNGVRCWYAPHHMEIGAPILNEINSAIRLHDKLLLILSESSVGSRWVEHEVLSATSKEFQQERDTRTLFPVRLDDAVMDTNVQWARNLKETRHIADFTEWKDHDSYKKAFDRLLRDLKGKS